MVHEVDLEICFENIRQNTTFPNPSWQRIFMQLPNVMSRMSKKFKNSLQQLKFRHSQQLHAVLHMCKIHKDGNHYYANKLVNCNINSPQKWTPTSQTRQSFVGNWSLAQIQHLQFWHVLRQ